MRIIILTCSLFACTNHQLYDTMQNHSKIQCQKLPEYQQDTCLNEHDVTYDEYKTAKDKI